MQAIETQHNGYRFRSRLEARWAIFLDTLGVLYEYEPEGFILDDGSWYLPDFRVMCHGTRGNRYGAEFPLYIEVKGVMTADDANKIRQFCGLGPNRNKQLDHPALLIVDRIPVHGVATQAEYMGCYVPMGSTGLHPYNYQTVDGDFFGAFPAADDKGRFYLMGDDDNYINLDDVPRVRNAYDRARMARFEYGEG